MTKLIPILILLTVLIAACGEGETAVPPTPAPETAAEAPVAENATPEAPAQDPPPAQELPTATAEQPTAEPPIAEPPAAGTPTEEPPLIILDDMVAGSDAGWGESGTTAQSACDHPYFPLRSGMTWSMAGGDGEEITWEVTDVEGDLTQATADLMMRSAGLTFTYTWECSADGGLSSFGFTNQGLAALGPEVEIEVVDGSGFFLPDPELLQPGYSWDTTYQTFYSMTQLDGELEMVIDGEMDTQQTSTVISMEPVTFQGESVPGLILQQDTQIDTAMAMLGETIESSVLMGAEIELGRGLGMLRQTTFTEFGDFTMEVTEIYVP